MGRNGWLEMGINLSEWVRDIAKKGNLTDQEIQTFEALLTKPGVKQEIVDGFERQSDYSRRMQELQAQRTQEDEYAMRLVEWEKDVKEQLAQATQQANLYKNQIYAIASQYGVSPDELTKALNTTPTSTPVAASAAYQSTPAAAQPAGDWVTKEQIDTYAAAMFKLNTQMIALNQEHIRLFGKPMENIEAFADSALKNGRPVMETFREFYKVGEREDQIREEQTQARITKAIEEAKQSWITAGANPLAAQQNVPKGWGSPVLEQVDRDAKELGDNAMHRTRVQEAVQAFNQAQAAQGLPTA